MHITDQGTGYKVESNGAIMFVPKDPANADYQRVQEAIADGAEVIIPAPPVIEPTLTAEQWVYFLEQTQWTALIKQATDMMPPGPVRSALIAAQATTTAFRLPVLLKVVGRVRAMGLDLTIPTDEQITAAFEEASSFEGLGALLE